jgi:hypothetical protein
MPVEPAVKNPIADDQRSGVGTVAVIARFARERRLVFVFPLVAPVAASAARTDSVLPVR